MGFQAGNQHSDLGNDVVSASPTPEAAAAAAAAGIVDTTAAPEDSATAEPAATGYDGPSQGTDDSTDPTAGSGLPPRRR